MRLFLRIAPETNIIIAKNYEFVAEKNLHLVLCPIPEFIGAVKCDCGEPATVLLNEETYKCNSCLIFLIPHTKLESNDDLSFPITFQTIKEMRFEWSTNGEKWYNVWGRNIETSNWNALLKELKAMALDKKEIEINGSYDPDNKHMQIY